MNRSLRFVIAALVAAPLAACAGAPRPEARMASSEGAIRGAQEAGAQNVPQATLFLKLAQEQRQQGLELVKDGNNHRAEYTLERSEADAELAIAVAHAASAQGAAVHANEQVQELDKKGTP
jgi:glycerol-3-phosphate dehydrogenase